MCSSDLHDVPASALILATVTAALAALERRTIAALVTTGALAGAAVATKHSVFLVVLLAALAAVFARDHALVRRLLATGIAAVGAYALLSPYPSSASTTRSRRSTSRAS